MMIITTKTLRPDGDIMTSGDWVWHSGSWHTGEIMRIPEGAVVEFVCDGDELEFVVEALRDARVRVVWPSEKLTPIY